MIVKFTFFLFSNITLILYLAFLLAFQFFFMLTYIFLKCNTFLFISQFFYNPIPFSLFSDILFVKNLSLHFSVFHVFYLFFVQYIQKRQNTFFWHLAAVLLSDTMFFRLFFLSVLFCCANRMHNLIENMVSNHGSLHNSVVCPEKECIDRDRAA